MAQSFKRDVVWLFLIKISYVVLSFISGVIIARALGPTDRGILGVFGTIVALLTYCCDIGLTSASLYYLGKETGIWWIFLIFIFFIFLFFIIIEPRVTCCHCPYYAEKRIRFRCTGNIILPKIWKYRPEPINKYEKVVTFIGFAFLGLFPIFAEIFGLWYFYSNGVNIFDLSFSREIDTDRRVTLFVNELVRVNFFDFEKLNNKLKERINNNRHNLARAFSIHYHQRVETIVQLIEKHQ